MRRILFSLALAVALLVQSPMPADACGDKLLVLGRGVRFQSRHTPRAVSVLLYLPAATRGVGPLSDPKLESSLTEAGHKVRSVTSKEELNEALRSSQYDVVLTDLAAASDLQRALTADATNPVVVPAVYLVAPASQQQAKADTAKAGKEFSVVLQVPDRPGHYCATVDKAMELKLKKDRSKTPRS